MGSDRTPIRSDGSFVASITAPVAFGSVPREYPLFLAASDEAQTLTMIAELPKDLAVDGAELEIDINPATTVSSEMICPGGAYPPPANTWCYSDPKAPSADNTAMISLLEKALAGSLIGLQTGTPPQWDTFANGFLNEPATYAEIKSNLTGQGVPFAAATPMSLGSAIMGAPFPIVTPPSASSGGSSGTSGGAGCKLKWDCGTSGQCASVYGAPTGTAAQPDAATCASTCKAQGACTCVGC